MLISMMLNGYLIICLYNYFFFIISMFEKQFHFAGADSKILF